MTIDPVAYGSAKLKHLGSNLNLNFDCEAFSMIYLAFFQPVYFGIQSFTKLGVTASPILKL